MVFQRRRPSVDIDRRVEGLQVEALQCMIPGEAATPLNQAGDLLMRAGDPAGALELYGQAVDSLVEADRFDSCVHVRLPLCLALMGRRVALNP